MNPFTVNWDDQVQADFINAWTSADSATRTELTDLANSVDAALSQSPGAKGHSFPKKAEGS